MIDQRGNGVLLPVFSLPGKYGIGAFSKEARKFIDFLCASGSKYWQILPLGPTSYGDSPYQSFSTFAINPYFIDIDTLVSDGLLTRGEANRLKPDKTSNSSYINYEWLFNTRLAGLEKAYKRFDAKSESFIEFCRKNEDWIYDYALFMAIKRENGDISFNNWPKEIKRRDENELRACEVALNDAIEFYLFLQYIATMQWLEIKKYANERGIKIIGDIPIYVAYDSADVWTKPYLFQMDSEGNPKAVAGCPPDGFSEDGQLWGNPLYDWEYHKSTGYEWWIRRIEKCTELYDVIRIDHFRGFDEYYSVPFGDSTARNGKWNKGPGIDLFNAIKNKLGDIDIIAEDLGYITDSVKKLVENTGFPNMKVLEFAFDARDSSGPSLYLPHNYGKNCVVYTGTHDNETLKGWLKSIQKDEFKMVREYVGKQSATICELTEELVRLAFSSTANLCIIPMQDFLSLGNEARINHPSTLGGNWVWRMDGKCIGNSLAKRIHKLTIVYGRE